MAESLRALQRPGEGESEAANELQATIESLHVHRIELEMQNRALRETQAELEAATHRWADLYDQLPVACLTLAPTSRILAANLPAAAWLQCDRPMLSQLYLHSFFCPDDAPRLASYLERCAVSSTPEMFEGTLQLGRARGMCVQLATRRLDEPGPDGKPQLLTTMADLNRQRRAEDTLQEIRVEQDAVCRSLSHEIRAPVVTIATFAEIVLEEHRGALTDEARSMLERISRAADRLNAMLTKLRDYATIARAPNPRDALDLDQILRGVLTEFRDVITRSDARIEIVRPLPKVRGGTLLVSQTVANLLSNALLYVRPGESPSIHISGHRNGTAVILRVQDRGIGIDGKDHQRIFDLFERLHCRVAYPGSGIGLSIVRRAVELLGGRVWVDSVLDEGATFSIQLPAAM